MMTTPGKWLSEWPEDGAYGAPDPEVKCSFIRAVQADAIGACVDITHFWLAMLNATPEKLAAAEEAALAVVKGRRESDK